ncbi:MAG TPA: hypothetical protein PKO15_16990 [Fibrobacteria bacterium]|nr:hypothetical protein [Fibrobacteria bacterium]HOX53594.1 hypothetical protein [Fibrobacteria bacterium]
MRLVKPFLLAGLAALAMSGCKPDRPDCPPRPLVDSTGEADQRDRLEIQWLRIRGGLDSAQRDPAVRLRLERSVHSLDSSALRYRDSLGTVPRGIGSVSGCVDWNATLRGDRVDRQGLLTAWTRSLVDPRAVALEWTIFDTTADSSRVAVLYQIPGDNGGVLDSLRLRIGVREIVRER